MRRRVAAQFVVAASVALLATVAGAGTFEITPAIQAELDKQKATVASWAADPTIVNAVVQQNRRGPIPGMDNPKWKVTRRSDSTVTGLQSNPAGQYLKAKLAGSQGVFSEAFLNAAQGEKVAFVEKTTSYIHKGHAKFDVPFNSGRAWQGPPEFDESTQTYAIQISVPVQADGRSVGALVVGVNLGHLEKFVKK